MSKKEKIQEAIKKIKKLQNHPDYEAAFVFGSVARDEIIEFSDLDVKVITTQDNPSIDILHPYIDGVKLDLSFQSYDQFLHNLKKEDENKIPQRITMIGESFILFDKTGFLTELREHYIKRGPKKFEPKDYEFQNFIIHHINNKVERNLLTDPHSSLLAMHMGIGELLKIHYALQGHWWLSDKRLLKDLDSWDKVLADLLRKFISTSEVKTKFEFWTQIIDHVQHIMGGRKDILRQKVISKVSKKGLKDLLSG